MAIFFCIVGFILIVIFIFSGQENESKPPPAIKLPPSPKTQQIKEIEEKAPDARQFNKIGVEKFNSEEYREAIDYFNKAIETKKNPVYYYNRGYSKFLIGEYQEAITDFSSAITTEEKSNDDYFDKRAKAYWKLNRFSEASYDYTQAIKIKEEPKYFGDRAYCKIKLKDYHGAIEDLNTAIKLAPSAKYFNERANCKAKLKDYISAIEDCNSAVLLSPTAAHLNNRSVKKAKSGDFLGAIEDCSSAIEKNDKDWLYFQNRGKYYFNIGKAIEAENDLKRAVSLGGTESATEVLQKFFGKSIEILEENSFEPQSQLKFNISNTAALGYRYFALWDYYPVNRFPASTLSKTDLEHRNHVFEFKDGKNPILYAELIASALINHFGKEDLRKKMLLIIPASSEAKTKKRFELFCTKLCELTKLGNGYNILSNNNKEKLPVHAGGNRNEDITKYISFNGNVENRQLIVVDDVRTSGNSSNHLYMFLKSKGASEIVFIYVGKTV